MATSEQEAQLHNMCSDKRACLEELKLHPLSEAQALQMIQQNQNRWEGPDRNIPEYQMTHIWNQKGCRAPGDVQMHKDVTEEFKQYIDSFDLQIKEREERCVAEQIERVRL